MASNFLRTLFRPGAIAQQKAWGSYESYARMIAAGAPGPDELGDKETAFIAARDSFYIASRTDDGWPYIQHRGGPKGFLKRLGGNRLGFADYRGNRQYLSVANIEADDRVALFLMDYPNRRRLKMIGHARRIDAGDDPETAQALQDPGYPAKIERGFLIDIVGFDWNCPQHITPRFDAEAIAEHVRPLHDEIADLKSRIAALTARTDQGD